VGRFLVVEPTGLEPVTPCLQSGGITGYEGMSALVDPHLDSPGRVEWWHCCCTSLLYSREHERVSPSVLTSALSGRFRPVERPQAPLCGRVLSAGRLGRIYDPCVVLAGLVSPARPLLQTSCRQESRSAGLRQ
jgi:hypothetical protein